MCFVKCCKLNPTVEFNNRSICWVVILFTLSFFTFVTTPVVAVSAAHVYSISLSYPSPSPTHQVGKKLETVAGRRELEDKFKICKPGTLEDPKNREQFAGECGGFVLNVEWILNCWFGYAVYFDTLMCLATECMTKTEV